MPSQAHQILESSAALGYHRVRTLKEDFFSENHLMEKGGERYVLKISRLPFAGGSILKFFARRLARHEVQSYNIAAGIAGIPEVVQCVGQTAFVHRYVEGETLKQVRRRARQRGNVAAALPTDFFSRLGETVAELHRRKMAHVDLAKGENIIVDSSGVPALIDFQICFHCKSPFARYLTASIFRILVETDRYHLAKHKQRFHPHLLSQSEKKLLARPVWIRCHRLLIAGPLLRLKRTVYPKGSNERG